MELIKSILIGLVAAEHIYIMLLEMCWWETKGKKVFKGAMPERLFAETKGLAANQGLYNGFLAAGLIWSLLIGDAAWSRNVALFFLGCVVVAAVYGAVTAHRKILLIQGGPAILALLALLFL